MFGGLAPRPLCTNRLLRSTVTFGHNLPTLTFKFRRPKFCQKVGTMGVYHKKNLAPSTSKFPRATPPKLWHSLWHDVRYKPWKFGDMTCVRPVFELTYFNNDASVWRIVANILQNGVIIFGWILLHSRYSACRYSTMAPQWAVEAALRSLVTKEPCLWASSSHHTVLIHTELQGWGLSRV